MATTTFLGNATCNITQGVTTYDVTDQLSSAVLTVGNDALETTAFSTSNPTGRTYTAGLQQGELTLTLYLSYGSGEVEAALAACVGKTSTIVISPSGTTESPSNPEYTIEGFLESFSPLNSSIGELSTVDAVFTVSSWTRDIT
jgi:hypothetical protein